jgi:hypothetical protein
MSTSSLTIVAIVTTVAGKEKALRAAQQKLLAETVTAPPKLKNPDALEWMKTIPALGRNSPEYAILHVDPHTTLTTLMFRTPVAVGRGRRHNGRY